MCPRCGKRSFTPGLTGLLYAVPVKKGQVEVIEDIVPLYDVEVRLRPGRPVKAVRLEPQGVELPFDKDADGAIRYTVPRLECHQMAVVEFT